MLSALALPELASIGYGVDVKITVFSAQRYDRTFLDEALATFSGELNVELHYQEAALSPATAVLAQGSTGVCVFVNDRLDAPVLEQLAASGVRAVFLRCAGFNNIDVMAAERLGLFVARVPAYSPEAVAEHALALVMTLNRQTHRAWLRVRDQNFTLDGLLGSTLHGKTVGIVGTGKIGLATARIFAGMGCRVIGFDPFPNAAFRTLGEYQSLDALLTRSDIVSLHCPLSATTRHLINRGTLAQMKHGAMLVNTSRGALVDTQAVLESLKLRHLGFLAIDVYEQEQNVFFRDHSASGIDDDVLQLLLTFPNVLVTGHQGFFTVEAMREIAQTTIDNIRCFVTGAACMNVIPQ